MHNLDDIDDNNHLKEDCVVFFIVFLCLMVIVGSAVNWSYMFHIKDLLFWTIRTWVTALL